MTPPKRGKIPYHDVFMGTLPSSRRGKCVTLFGGVRGPPRNSSACKQQQGRYTNYCCNPYGKAAPHQFVVNFPFRDFSDELGSSRDTAVYRLQQIERRFSKNKSLSDQYHKFMNGYLKLGHMELIV
ncbi:hypothetical protein TNCV_4155061 [Trichonephila clavipes]|nr:hypothetical protein TNCV_4155061 [Trichonephila clavipes]